MSDKPQYRPLNIRTTQDERILEFRHAPNNLELPSVGIFDEPLRCYKVNEQWAAIITGAVSLLAEISAWKDAENEGYTGIIEILRYLEGEGCMDCNDVENCLQTSATIIAIQDAIDALEANDAIQDTNIADNQAAINTNANNISDHETRISDAEISIQQHNLDISDLQTRMNSAEISIQQHNLDISDHETRITDLENASGGGSGGGNSAISDAIHHLFSSNSVTAGTSWYEAVAIDYNFTYENVVIIAELKIQPTGTGNIARARLRVSDGTNDIAVGTNEAHAWSDVVSTQVAQKLVLSQTGSLKIHIDIASDDTQAVLMRKNQQISVSIVEFSETTQILNDPIITFEPDSDPYSLPSPNVGVVSSGGNPSQCLLKQTLLDTEEMIVEVDLGETKQIDDIAYDLLSSGNSVIQFFSDGVLEFTLQPSDTNSAWQSKTISSALFPFQAKVIRMVVSPPSGDTIADIRIDNIAIFTT